MAADGDALRAVDYLLVAEFDIDRGSSLAHCYPSPVPGYEESFFAEAMLPDGAHDREEDWTVFFLNRDSMPCRHLQPQRKYRYPVRLEAGGVATEWRQLSGTGVTLLQLSHTAAAGGSGGAEAGGDGGDGGSEESGGGAGGRGSGSGDGGGAAAAVLTFVDEGGRLLAEVVLARDVAHVQTEPGMVTLLRHAEAGVPLRFTFLAEDDHEAYDSALLVAAEEATEAAPWLYALNLVRSKKDASVRRGAVVKALALCSRFPWVERLKPVIVQALHSYYDAPTVDTVRAVFNALAALPVDRLPQPSLLQRSLMRRNTAVSVLSSPSPFDEERHISLRTVDMSVGWKDASHSIALQLPLHLEPDELGRLVSVTSLLHTFGAGVMAIFNGVLLEKRVLFIGHRLRAEAVCVAVLSSVAMLAPPLSGLLRRAHPYVNLVNLDFLQQPAFLAGVTNPMFADRKEWWDVLCDLSTGAVSHGEEKGEERDAEPHDALDSEFIDAVLAGVRRGQPEAWVRAQFHDYALQLIDAMDGSAQFRDGDALMAYTKSNTKRLRAMALTAACPGFAARRPIGRSPHSPFNSELRGQDLLATVRRLQHCWQLSDGDVRGMFESLLKNFVTERDMLELLYVLPDSQGGLYPIAMGLLHRDARVRCCAVHLLQRIDSFASTKVTVRTLNVFLLTSFQRESERLAKEGGHAVLPAPAAAAAPPPAVSARWAK